MRVTLDIVLRVEIEASSAEKATDAALDAVAELRAAVLAEAEPTENSLALVNALGGALGGD